MYRILGRHGATHTLLFGVIEAALIGSVCVTAFGYFFFRAGVLSFDTLLFTVLPGFCVVALMHSGGLYDDEALVNFRRMLWRIGLVAVPIFVVAVWTTEEFAKHAVVRIHPYRLKWTLILTGFWLVSAVALRALFRQLNNSGWLTQRVLIVGADMHSAELADLAAISNDRFQLVEHIGAGDTERTSQFAAALAKDPGISEVVVAGDKAAAPWAQLASCRLSGVRVTDYLDFYEREARCICIDSLRGDWIALSQGFNIGGLRTLLRRGQDILLSIIGLVAVAPVLLMTALAIKLEDGGPVIYPQERVGLNGRSFVLFKFRSMRVDAEKDGAPAWAGERDSRITRVGRIIRQVRIDELPQLWNVLRGDMALVGPRPERPYFVRQFSESIPFYDYRHKVRPGLTGWAQVSFRYGASFDDAKRKLSYDLYYVKNQSFFLDVLILLKTVRVVLSGQGAR